MKKHVQIVTSLLLLFFTTEFKAQLSGSYAIPATYTSIAAAISDLNTLGISGPVTFNVNAGYTENAPVGGYTLNAVAGASAINQIIFQKNGAGANPLITAYTGTATPASAVQDGVWRFVGADYITINGIDINDPNTANPATMEFGYGFFKASVTDGCQNNTLQNCVITLNKINNAAGSGTAADGSRGIDVVNALTTAHTTALTITSASGANSNNKFYANTIQNCNYGMALIGYAAATPFTLADDGNDIGGSSAATGNTIINFGGGGVTSPAAGVRTLAQYDINISNNSINSNNGSGINHASTLRGIYLNTATSANATITSNTITVKGGGTTSQLTAIENASGSTAASNTVTINTNIITGCTYTTATSGVFYGIYNNAASPSVLSINNNTFTANSSAATSGSYYSINNTGSVAFNLQINNNSIGSHSLTASATSLVYRGISTSLAGANAVVSVSGNTLQAVSFAGTASGTFSFLVTAGTATSGGITINANSMANVSVPTTGSCYFINNSNTSSNSTISNNTISGTFTKTAAGGTFYGYYNASASTGGISTITNNNISNVTLTGATGFYGIYQETSATQSSSVTTNTISNITAGASTVVGIGIGLGTANSVTGNLITNLSGSAAVYGIITEQGASTTLSVSTNTISTISSSGNSNVYGYYQTFGGTTSVYKNKIYDLSCTALNSTANVFGIYLSVGTTNKLYNNLIGDLRTPNGNVANGIVGIVITAGTTTNSLYYNSVYINASSTGALFGSTAVSSNITPNLDFRNNIFVNTSTPSGAGIVAAFRRNSTALTTYSTSSNNNLFYAGTPGTANLLFYDGTNSVQTISALKALMATRDAASVTENPTFVSTSGANADFLNINTSVPTQIESGAVPIATYTDDYAGNTRNAVTPDIGAWEGNYTPLDIQAPAVSNPQMTSGCSVTAATFTATISDPSGVATGTLSPRLYYTINSGTYTSVQGTLVTGNTTSGTWSFSPVFSANNGDVISYYVVTQDMAATPNVGATPGVGFTGTDVNTVTAPPTTPSTYTIYGTLNGIYNVGAGQAFTTLSEAANIYNNACLTGAVKFILTDALYSTAEVFPIVFKNNPDASATNSLSIVPNAGVASVISGTNTAAAAVIKFLNASYITIDGLNTGGSSLTLNNPAAGASTANIWLSSTASTGPGNNTIGIKNLMINGSSNTVTTSFGIVACVDGTNPSNTGGMDNDNITVSGNTVLNSYYGIYAAGTTNVSAGGLDNWTIANNTIGPVVTGTNTIGASGIHVQDALNLTVTNNLVQNIKTSISNKAGIFLSSNINGATVSQNTVSNVYCSSLSSGASAICGVYVGSNVLNAAISSNQVSTIVNTSTAGYSAKGMILNTGNAASNMNVYNNFVSDIYAYSGISTLYWVTGIDLEGVTGGVNIDNNTVNLSGSHVGYNAATVSAALYMNASGGNINVRDNIFSNTYDNSTVSTDINYSIYSTVASSNFSTIDYNDYYVGGSGNNPILGYLGSARNTLTAIQTGFGGNLNSQNILPVFTSNTDLHLIPVSNISLNNLGTPLAGITTDIDNQLRSTTTPDIGADEYTAPLCNATNGGTVTAVNASVCTNDTIKLNASGASSGQGLSHQWQISTTAGGPYTNVTGGLGDTTANYAIATLTSGTYYFVLQTTCASASLSSLSNEYTVPVNALPTITVNSGSVCAGNSFTITPGGAVTYTYSNGSNIIIPASDAGYTVTGTDANGCKNTAVSMVTVNPLPIVTVNSGSVCVGNSFTITPGGAVTYTYSNGSNIMMPTSNTGYTVTGTDANGCENTAVGMVMVNPLPIVTVNSGSVCAGSSFTMTANGANTYTWSPAGSLSSSTGTPVTLTASGSGTYTVIGTDVNGCENTAVSLITVNMLPVVSLTASTGTVCLNGSGVSLTGSPGGGIYSGANVSGNMFNPASNGTFTPVYSYTDTNTGCADMASVSIVVNTCTTTDIAITTSLIDVSIYPNPTSGEFTLEQANGADKIITVTDVTGRIVLETISNADKIQVNSNNLPSGVYYVQVRSNATIRVLKMVKQ